MASIQRQIVYAATALTATTTNGDALSLIARAQCPIGYLVVTAPNGATTVAARIQHSPDGVTGWTDFITFTTTVAGAVANQVTKSTNDSVLPYVRAVVVLGGATQVATVGVFLYTEPF